MDQPLSNSKMERSLALDALRGMSILLMVLSGSIAFGDVLPAWMYHAQVPPPDHVFKPEIPGITWVDLVFPFFLFSMGVAIPLSLRKKWTHQGILKTFWSILERYGLLVFFAMFTFDARAWEMAKDFGTKENILSIGCFILLFFMYAHTTFESEKVAFARKFLGFSLAILFLAFFQFKGEGFDRNKSDIIIIVLANMALFGALIWCFTQHHPLYRLAILPLIMAIFLSGKVSGSWTSTLYNWSPIPWAYTFYYLKYLFIVIPGTLAGDWLLNSSQLEVHKESKEWGLLSFLPIVLVVLNVILLYARFLGTNLLISALMAIMLVYLSKGPAHSKGFNKFLYAGLYLLFLGLCFEAYEGGIKKDYSTYSYYFVTAGAAFLMIYSFLLLENFRYLKGPFRLLGQVGKNPMIAYTTGSLFLLPFLRLTHTESILNQLNQNALGGFMRGVIFTAVVAAITIFFTRKRIFWKT